MSQPSRPRTRGPALRRRRDYQLEAIAPLEDRALLAPIVTQFPLVATFTAATTPTNDNLGTVTIAPDTTVAYPSQVPVTTVTELTSNAAAFGGDIVRIKAGPGGDFGKGVYAISRGAGGNSGAINRPGVIYRVDPATGKSSVFFDLNTVVNQLQPPSSSAANSVSVASGLVNWYDLAFDPEGYFDGKPSLFVASVDSSDPNKNVIYRIGPDGSFMGAFVQFTTSLQFNIHPTSILVPPPEDQQFLGGLIAGTGNINTGGQFTALFFDKNAYSPGQVISSTTLPTGVRPTNLTAGPQVGLTAANSDYASRVYSAFTDFGAIVNDQAVPGFSGVQGNAAGESLIPPPATTTPTLDQTPLVRTPGRRFEDIAFDQYGYFSQGLPITTTTTGGTTATLGTPVAAGSVFVADLATGLQVTVTPVAPLPTTPTINIPIQGPGVVGVTTDSNGNVVPIVSGGNTTGGTNIGGRIIRILPNGTVTTFAQGFNTSGAQNSSSFINSSLSITFSADGTTLYASDDDGIWQFKTTASLANSTSGSLIGLNDLQTLGVPYEGQDAAVAIIDSGVDGSSPPFRGRVSPGTNVVTGGTGNDDLSPANATTTTTGTTTSGNNNLITGNDGHGTLVAGVVAQFVPQATIEPVDVFNPFIAFSTSTTTTGTTTGTATTGTTTGTATLVGNSNAYTSSNNVYNGIKYVADHPFVNDPVRPNKAARVIAATFGFGSTTTFDSEGAAYRQFPQLIATLKNQLKRYRALGIAPVAAAGQFGSPLAASGTTTTSTTATSTTGATNNSLNTNVGDVNGMSLPAILNEAISVTGVIPFPYTANRSSLPTDPALGVTPRPPAPVLISSGTTTTTTTTTTNQVLSLLAGNTPVGISTSTTSTTTNSSLQGLYADRIVAAANRGVTTDFAAPAVDIPTFRRRFSVATTTTTGTTATTSTDPLDHLAFQDAGTSLSAGIVTGSFAVVSSALNYWTQLNASQGTTSNAYLTQPVGKTVLNFGPHAFKDLSAYNNPDGINSILQWTAVPANDPFDGLSQSDPPYLFRSTHFRDFARIDVGNAIAAIEGEVAIQYLLDHNIFPIIDSNKDSIITTQELQNFVDNPSSPEAGAMARLLGGTASTTGNATTSFGEQPDQPGALQRRFNFFDYAADGQLNGSVTIDQFKMLAHTLLPTPDSFVVNDRQRASVNGFLLDPNAKRNTSDLKHIQPRYQFVPKAALRKYRGLAPDNLKFNRLVQNVDTPGTKFPIWTLFGSDSGGKVVSQTVKTPVQTPGTRGTTNVASNATTDNGKGASGGTTGTGNVASNATTDTANVASSGSTQTTPATVTSPSGSLTSVANSTSAGNAALKQVKSVIDKALS